MERLPPALAWALSSNTVMLRNSTATSTLQTLTICFFIFIAPCCVRSYFDAVDLLPATVAVQPRQEQVDAQVAEDGGGKADDRKPGGTLADPAAGEAGMQEGGIYEPDDQRPGLFRVPAPVGAPGVVGPGGAGDDTQGQQGEADHDGPVVEVIQYPDGGEHAHDARLARLLPALIVGGLDQVHDGDAAGYGKGGIAEEAGDDVVQEPVALQGRYERLNAGVHAELCPGHAQEGKGHDKGADDPVFVLDVEQGEDQYDRPGEKDDRLVEV